jgi:hypothetical protein
MKTSKLIVIKDENYMKLYELKKKSFFFFSGFFQKTLFGN